MIETDFYFAETPWTAGSVSKQSADKYNGSYRKFVGSWWFSGGAYLQGKHVLSIGSVKSQYELKKLLCLFISHVPYCSCAVS